MLFIFDWDGTLVDSIAKIVSCMHPAISEVGLPSRSDLEISNIIGLGLPEAGLALFPDQSEEQRSALVAAYSRHFIAAAQEVCEFFPGALSFIESLRAAGHLTAVATGKSRRGLQREFDAKGVEHLFDASRCADETASKPAPLMLQQLLDECGVDASAALMIGDTEYDLEMASNAGVASIGVSFGAHSVERLRQHRPVTVIDSYDAMSKWWQLNEWGGR